MYSAMCFHGWQQFKLFVAYIATMRKLIAMHNAMPIHVTEFPKHKTADVACIWLCAAVDKHVSGQVRLSRKAILANIAAVLFKARMNGSMFCQASVASEKKTALITLDFVIFRFVKYPENPILRTGFHMLIY